MKKQGAINEKEIIKAILKRGGMTQKGLSEKMGISQKILTNRLNQSATINLSTLYEMLEYLGYEIVVREKNTSGAEFVISEESEPIGREQYLSETQKAEISERVAAKEMETEQEMAQLKRMMRK